MPAVTMRAIAAATGVSQASLASHLGGRQHLLQVVAWRFGTLRVEEMEHRAHSEGLMALLPACADDIADLRVWLSWCDLGRTNEGVGHAVAEIEDRELGLVVGRLPRDRVAAARDVMSVLHGVRHLLCAPRGPLTPDAAREVAQRLLPALGA
jgi:AcrR family transcriptional regulator